MEGFMEKVQRTQVPYGSGVLWWLGQMGLLVKLGESVLCIDYYASDSPDRQVPPPVPMEEVSGVDLFFGTHDHTDHIDHPAWKVWARTCPKARFVFPRVHQEKIRADGIEEERCVGLEDGESVRIGEIQIHALAAAHEFLETDPTPCLQYVIEGNGVRIYHAGDTLRYEGMRPRLQAFGKLDAALLPINGRDARRYANNCIGNMTFQEAADLAGELGPGLVIPGHFDMFAGNSEDPERFAAYLEVKYEGAAPCQVPWYRQPIFIGASAQKAKEEKG